MSYFFGDMHSESEISFSYFLDNETDFEDIFASEDEFEVKVSYPQLLSSEQEDKPEKAKSHPEEGGALEKVALEKARLDSAEEMSIHSEKDRRSHSEEGRAPKMATSAMVASEKVKPEMAKLLF